MESLRNIIEHVMCELRLLSLTSHQQQIPMSCSSSLYIYCLCYAEPSMEMSCSCECQLIEDQVTEIKTGLCYQEDNVKEIDCQIKEYIRQNRLLREELTTVKGQVGSKCIV